MAVTDLSGRGILAAANPLSRWVLFDGCPVVIVHFSRGLALHTGHGTDNIRFCVSGAVSTPNCSTWGILKMVNFALLFDRS
jgi:hypothetical protein